MALPASFHESGAVEFVANVGIETTSVEFETLNEKFAQHSFVAVSCRLAEIMIVDRTDRSSIAHGRMNSCGVDLLLLRLVPRAERLILRTLNKALQLFPPQSYVRLSRLRQLPGRQAACAGSEAASPCPARTSLV